MDVTKYLERINYKGPINTNPSTLCDLCDCHTKTVPFEVLDMFGGKRKVSDLDKIYNNIVTNKRGGFCYENNGLFSWLLEELGFQVEILQAQSYDKTTQMFGPDFDHMSLLVTCGNGEQWLTDIGWGGTGFILPLKFKEMIEQTQRNGVYRLRRVDQEKDTYLLEKVVKQVLKENEKKTDQVPPQIWEIVYKFDTTPRKTSDFETMYGYQQDSESSFLKYNTIASIQNESGMISTWGHVVKKRIYIDPYTEIQMTHTTQNVEELKKVFKDEMGMNIDFNLQVESKDLQMICALAKLSI